MPERVPTYTTSSSNHSPRGSGPPTVLGEWRGFIVCSAPRGRRERGKGPVFSLNQRPSVPRLSPLLCHPQGQPFPGGPGRSVSRHRIFPPPPPPRHRSAPACAGRSRCRCRCCARETLLHAPEAPLYPRWSRPEHPDAQRATRYEWALSSLRRL